MNTRTTRSTLISFLGVALALASGSAWAITFRITDLGTLGGTESVGTDLNDSGQVTGHSLGVDNSSDTAFLWDGTAMQDLGELEPTGGSAGRALNDSGQVTGGASVQLFNHAFLWDGTMMGDLGTLVDNAEGFSAGSDINASGQVTGFSGQAIGTTGDVVFLHAFLWDGTTMLDLGTLGVQIVLVPPSMTQGR